MDTTKMLELLSYTIPAIITGGIALYFFKKHTQNEESRRTYLLLKKKQTVALPLRFQAYERLALFLERISPAKLQIRITPNGTEILKYQNKLIATISQEFEHNLTQQIYVSDECWNIIVTSKNATIKSIIDQGTNQSLANANELREAILEQATKKEPPTSIALAYLKSEIRKIY
ncbi:MAG: hypothetical protein L3J08_01380 [Flavobacteriaceae bacterium]|nr:hypothetical protein [Flavobacteriaceae bacterium]